MVKLGITCWRCGHGQVCSAVCDSVKVIMDAASALTKTVQLAWSQTLFECSLYWQRTALLWQLENAGKHIPANQQLYVNEAVWPKTTAWFFFLFARPEDGACSQSGLVCCFMFVLMVCYFMFALFWWSVVSCLFCQLWWSIILCLFWWSVVSCFFCQL